MLANHVMRLKYSILHYAVNRNTFASLIARQDSLCLSHDILQGLLHCTHSSKCIFWKILGNSFNLHELVDGDETLLLLHIINVSSVTWSVLCL